MNISSQRIGADLERLARRVAPVIAAVYVAGYMLGRWLHRTNDRLAAAYVRLLGLAPVASDAPPIARPKVIVKATVTRQPLLTIDALINNHTQRELMVMAGTRSKSSKRVLAEKILAKTHKKKKTE